MPRELEVPLLFVPPEGWEILDVDATGVPEAAFGARSPASDGDFHPNVVVLRVPHAPDETLADVVARRTSSLLGLPAEVDVPGRTDTSGAVATHRRRVVVTVEVNGSLRELIEDQVFTDVTDPRTGRRGIAMVVLTSTAETRDAAVGVFADLLGTIRPESSTSVASGLAPACRDVEHRVAHHLTVPLVMSVPAGWIVADPDETDEGEAVAVHCPKGDGDLYPTIHVTDVTHEPDDTLEHVAECSVAAAADAGDVRVLEIDGAPSPGDVPRFRQLLLVGTEVGGERRDLLLDVVCLDLRDPRSGTRAIVRMHLVSTPRHGRDLTRTFHDVVASVRVDEARLVDPPRLAAAADPGELTIRDLRVPLLFGAPRDWDVVDPGGAGVAAVFTARSPESDEGFHPTIVVHALPHAPDETLADIAGRLAAQQRRVGDVTVVERSDGPTDPAPTFRQVLASTTRVAGDLREHHQEQVLMDFEHPETRRRSVTAFVLTTPPTLRLSSAQVFAEFLRTVRVDERRVGS